MRVRLGTIWNTTVYPYSWRNPAYRSCDPGHQALIRDPVWAGRTRGLWNHPTLFNRTEILHPTHHDLNGWQFRRETRFGRKRPDLDRLEQTQANCVRLCKSAILIDVAEVDDIMSGWFGLGLFHSVTWHVLSVALNLKRNAVDDGSKNTHNYVTL